jgi:hypothetical protein
MRLLRAEALATTASDCFITPFLAMTGRAEIHRSLLFESNRRDTFQRVDDLTQRKTDDVRAGAADLTDKAAAHPLDGVSARLVVRLLCARVPGDLVRGYSAEEDFGPHDLPDPNAPVLPEDAETGQDLVRPVAQFLKHLRCFLWQSRFPEDLSRDDHDRVGAEDPAIRVTLRNGESLFLGETKDVSLGSFSRPEGLVDVARHDIKIETHELQELNAAG